MNPVLLRCQSCGAINRVRREKIGDNPRCGSCHTAISIQRRPLDITASRYDAEVLAWPGSVLVEFWSPLCGHCIRMNPVIDEIAGRLAGVVKIVKVNIDLERQLAAQFGITGTPSFALFNGGHKSREIAGAMPRDQLLRWIEAGLQG